MSHIRFKVDEVSLRSILPSFSTKWYQGPNVGGKNAAIYVRQSSGDSTIDDQIRDCCLQARTHTYKKAFLYQDKGSAWKQNSVERLYGLQRLMLCVKKGYINTVFVYDISRLCRNMEMGSKLLNGIKTYNLKIVSLLEQQTYTSDPKSCNEFLKKILEAQEYSTNLSVRIKDNVRHRRSKGHRFGNPRYGQKAVKIDGIRKFTICNDEQKIIKIIKDRIRMRNQSCHKISDWLNAKAYTKRRKKWTPSSVSTIVVNRFDMDGLTASLPTYSTRS